MAKNGDEWLDSCIWIDPGRQTGQPCLGGTRIPVEVIVSLIRDRGLDDDHVINSYPSVTREHLKAVRWWDETGRAQIAAEHRRSRKRNG